MLCEDVKSSDVSLTGDSINDCHLLEKGISISTTPVSGLVGFPVAHNLGSMAPIVNKGRHIFIKDTAFQTFVVQPPHLAHQTDPLRWYCLLCYLSTGRVLLLPPRSLGNQVSQRVNLDASEEPRCSAKSMFRLASKVRNTYSFI